MKSSPRVADCGSSLCETLESKDHIGLYRLGIGWHFLFVPGESDSVTSEIVREFIEVAPIGWMQQVAITGPDVGDGHNTVMHRYVNLGIFILARTYPYRCGGKERELVTDFWHLAGRIVFQQHATNAHIVAFAEYHNYRFRRHIYLHQAFHENILAESCMEGNHKPLIYNIKIVILSRRRDIML